MPSDSVSSSRWSRATAPNSLITTAVSARSGLASTRPRNVVLPLPRKPVSTDRGIGSSGTAASAFRPGGIYWRSPAWRSSGITALSKYLSSSL